VDSAISNTTPASFQRNDERKTTVLFLQKKHLHETEFFIYKAIGWALRQYLYTAPKAVIQFVKEYRNELSPLSTTEVLKALKRNSYI